MEVAKGICSINKEITKYNSVVLIEQSITGLFEKKRFANSMSWRIIVISHRAKLDYKLGCMEIRNETTVLIHLTEISTVMVESTAVSLTASLISELAKKEDKSDFL